MLNFSAIPSSTVLGRALRLPLRLVPKGAVVRVLQGPLRGKRWIAGASNHGCWLGSYEAAKQKRIVELVQPGMVCWDVGAHVGFYTLLFSHLVGPKGKAIAFEPFPPNLELLRRHIQMNRCGNVQVFPVALADSDGAEDFEPGGNSSTGRLRPGGGIRVLVRKADTLVYSGEASAPDLIKIDVEGAEARVLRGAVDLMRRRRPILLLATHGQVQHRDCLRILWELGYRVESLDRRPVEETDELVALP